MPTLDEQIAEFLSGSPHAVVGASPKREKYGNKVLRAYLQNERAAIPVHPAADIVEGLEVAPDLASVPEDVHGVSIITPAPVTRATMEAGVELGIRHYWLQPGAEFDGWEEFAAEHDLNVIAGGPCLLVKLGYRESE